MISFYNLWKYPAGQPLISDDILEFHAARLLLLLDLCGTKGHIDGLTKLAKLDFFVRYPQFFNTVSVFMDQAAEPSSHSIESRMIRYHYGPWDKRYYDVLSYLKSKDLVLISMKTKNSFRFDLTDLGKKTAQDLVKESEFSELVSQMEKVKKILGQKSGTALKNLIYDIFDQEVAKKPFEGVI